MKTLFTLFLSIKKRHLISIEKNYSMKNIAHIPKKNSIKIYYYYYYYYCCCCCCCCYYYQLSIVQMAVFIMENALVRYVSVIRDGLEKTALNSTAMICRTVPVTANVWVLMCASVIRDIW